MLYEYCKANGFCDFCDIHNVMNYGYLTSVSADIKCNGIGDYSTVNQRSS